MQRDFAMKSCLKTELTLLWIFGWSLIRCFWMIQSGRFWCFSLWIQLVLKYAYNNRSQLAKHRSSSNFSFQSRCAMRWLLNLNYFAPLIDLIEKYVIIIKNHVSVSLIKRSFSKINVHCCLHFWPLGNVKAFSNCFFLRCGFYFVRNIRCYVLRIYGNRFDTTLWLGDSKGIQSVKPTWLHISKPEATSNP